MLCYFEYGFTKLNNHEERAEITMKRLIITLLFVLSAVTFACAGDDAHFIGDDIYFVSEQALGGEPWINA